MIQWLILIPQAILEASSSFGTQNYLFIYYYLKCYFFVCLFGIPLFYSYAQGSYQIKTVQINYIRSTNQKIDGDSDEMQNQRHHFSSQFLFFLRGRLCQPIDVMNWCSLLAYEEITTFVLFLLKLKNQKLWH